MGVNETCPRGKEIRTKARCQEVLKYASYLGVDESKNMGYSLNETWTKRPLRCSVGSSSTKNRKGKLIYNQRDYTTNRGLYKGEFVMICEKGKSFVQYLRSKHVYVLLHVPSISLVFHIFICFA